MTNSNPTITSQTIASPVGRQKTGSGLAAIPNIVTLLNLAFGVMAIIYAMQSGISPAFDESGRADYSSNGIQYINLPEKLWMASLCIGIAGVIDFLDGFVARLLGASSEMGKQLDSLSDVVSFGVAPGIIIYQFLRLSLAQEDGGLDASVIWLLPALLIPMAGAYRLARFNIDTKQTHSFLGVPIPAAGLLLASFPLIYWNTSIQWVVQLLLSKWFLYAVCFIISYLMISRLPMMALKFKDYSVKNNLPKYILLAASLGAIIFLKWLAAPVIFIIYVLLSLFTKEPVEPVSDNQTPTLDLTV